MLPRLKVKYSLYLCTRDCGAQNESISKKTCESCHINMDKELTSTSRVIFHPPFVFPFKKLSDLFRSDPIVTHIKPIILHSKRAVWMVAE